MDREAQRMMDRHVAVEEGMQANAAKVDADRQAAADAALFDGAVPSTAADIIDYLRDDTVDDTVRAQRAEVIRRLEEDRGKPRATVVAAYEAILGPG